MANASTIRRQIAGTQQLTLAPLQASVISTTKTAFQLNNNGLTLTGGGVIPLSAGVTGLYAGTGQVIHVAATGQVAGATAGTSTLLLTLYEVPNSLLPIANTLSGAQTFTGWNSVAATSALELSDAADSWTFDARLQLDASGNLQGSWTATINGASIASWASITPITGLVGEADLNFVMAVTLGSAEPSTESITMTEFRLDLE